MGEQEIVLEDNSHSSNLRGNKYPRLRIVDNHAAQLDPALVDGNETGEDLYGSCLAGPVRP